MENPRSALLASLVDTARRFVREVILPNVLERDERGEVPFDWISELYARGLGRVTLPTSLGGHALSVRECCVLEEELAAGDHGFAAAITQNWKLAPVLAHADTPLGRSYYQRFLEDPKFLLAICITEEKAGSDNILPHGLLGSAIKTSVSMKPDGRWVLNGEKWMGTNAGAANLYFIVARSEFSAGLFMVTPDTPGFEVVRVDRKVGQKLLGTAVVRLTDCHVPADALVPAMSDPGVMLRLGMENGVHPAAHFLGVARAAMSEAMRFARSRVQGGRPIIEHDSIALMFADMDLRLETARLLTHRAAEAADTLERDERWAAMAKEYSAEASLDICLKCVEVLGGRGIMMDTLVQKCARDALTFAHTEGTQQIHRLRRAEQIKKGTGPAHLR